MRGPSEAPVIWTAFPSWSRTMEGDMEDMGILPGAMKLEAEAGMPYILAVFGVEKASISLLKIIPVRLPTTYDPNLSMN